MYYYLWSLHRNDAPCYRMLSKYFKDTWREFPVQRPISSIIFGGSRFGRVFGVSSLLPCWCNSRTTSDCIDCRREAIVAKDSKYSLWQILLTVTSPFVHLSFPLSRLLIALLSSTLVESKESFRSHPVLIRKPISRTSGLAH